jgi:hypothetical protein
MAKSPEESSNGFGRKWHRIATVRQQERISLRRVAKQIDAPIDDLRRQEDEQSDLRLSNLYAWQKALDVPVGELLIDESELGSYPLLVRQQLIKAMKTTLLLLEHGEGTPVGYLAQNLLEQLLVMMPELKSVTAWPRLGSVREKDRLPRILAEQISSDVFSH